LGNGTITNRTRALAERSANCVVCQRARRKQAGLAFWLVKTFEGLCPFCRAYEKVHGRKSHEPAPTAVAAGILPAIEGGILPPGQALKSSSATAKRTPKC
jgi:hypothetical protein